jgi:hypothetical protein
MNTALCSARPRTARGRSVWRSPKTKRALRGRRFPIESRVVSRAAGAPRARVFGGECLAERPLRTQLRQFFRRWRGGPHVLPPTHDNRALLVYVHSVGIFRSRVAKGKRSLLAGRSHSRSAGWGRRGPYTVIFSHPLLIYNMENLYIDRK